MGRKASEKNRKARTSKTKKWAEMLLPSLQNVSLKDITIDDIAQKMNKSKSTVYEYFKTKQEILTYVAEIRIEKLNLYRNELLSNNDNFTVIYQNIIEIICEGIQGISAHFLHELKENYPDAWQVIRSFLDQMLTDLRKFYTEGIANKVFHPVSVELLVSLDEHFAINIMTNERFLKEHNIPLETLVKDYLFMKFSGLNVGFS